MRAYIMHHCENRITFASENKKNRKKQKGSMKKVVIGFIMILQVAISLDLITSSASGSEMDEAEIAAKSCNTSNYIEVSDINELETYICTNK